MKQDLPNYQEVLRKNRDAWRKLKLDDQLTAAVQAADSCYPTGDFADSLAVQTRYSVVARRN